MKREIKKMSFEAVSMLSLGFISLLFFRSIETSQTKVLEITQESVVTVEKKQESLPDFKNSLLKFSEVNLLCKKDIKGSCLSDCPALEQEVIVAKEIDKKFVVEKKQVPVRVLGAEKTANGGERVVVPRPVARISVGKVSCANKNDHPRKSKTKGVHMDEDCCIDPDEYLNPRCAYSPHAVSIAKKR